MEININKLRSSIGHLIESLNSRKQLTETEDRVLRQFLNLNDYKEKDVSILLNFLSSKLLDENYTLLIGSIFQQWILLITTIAIPSNETINEDNFQNFQQKCVALSKLIHISTDVKRYATNYFLNKPAPFEKPEKAAENHTPKSKKMKKDSQEIEVTSSSLVKCCYHLLVKDPLYYSELWNWTHFIEEYLKSENRLNIQQIYINHIIAILTNMSAIQLKTLNEKIPANLLLDFEKEQQTLLKFTSLIPETIISSFDSSEEQTIIYNFSSDIVTNVEGVLLPIFSKDNYHFYKETDGSYDRIVKVDSTKVNLRSIALGIASGKAICLSGPVGCGKTTLVEYLARKTGRVAPKAQERAQQEQTTKENIQVNSNKKSLPNENVGNKRKSNLDDILDLENSLNISTAGSTNPNGFLRIQLGDQTDSKMLLGQYRCTDVPGEFIWLPGVLTQAVMNGYWLLLEDLDSATQDTFTILSSLLENNNLSVPGFRDSVKVEPGFQLFFTIRTNKSSFNSSQKSLYSLIQKHLYTINILPLSRNELCKVISTNYPKLATVANRIVDVFLTFSSGDHTSADNLRQQETADKADTTENFIALPFERVSLATIPNSGRLVSTRDLIKLCQRSNALFSVTSAECAYFVFQNAVDVFCSYLPEGKEKTKLIVSIGAKLGIIQSRCEHYSEDYKPEVKVEAQTIKVGRAELQAKDSMKNLDKRDEKDDLNSFKRQKLNENGDKTLIPIQKDLKRSATSIFSFTRISSCLLERISVCVANAEPVLLVGETGVGKTSSVQYLAERTQHKLVVVNMNNQSDVSDLVGGFKPVDLSYVVAPLRNEFELLFRNTFNQMKNESFLTKFAICYNQGNYVVIVQLMIRVTNNVFTKLENNQLTEKELQLIPRWQTLKIKLEKLNTQLIKSINISFAFIPGSLVNCIKNGDWVLLDEINLASAETLECLSTILEPDGSVVLLEMGDFTPVKRHSDFRIFACMNPNTDIGKKDLSIGIRNRFTEFFVDELTTDNDLSLLVSDYLSNTGIQSKSVTNIVKLYKKLRHLAKLELNDGLGNRPVFSLRTLCRSLRICARNLCGSIERNLYESFCLSFLTQLDPISHQTVVNLIKDALLNNAKSVLQQPLPKLGENYLNFESYWIQQGPQLLQECEDYILTESVKQNLKDLARIISIGKLPILLQGPTSAGKTSLIGYVAKKSGNHCLRINNHEHTDLQEYIGTYAADIFGKLSFKEGVLVQAMRNGYWIILDELNLASTDILEALNRVLDDNRELFIPETQTVIKAHPNFMLFATQNPPGLYGGRKTLSRAFKNRFIELHFSEIPRNELEIILEKRCLIPTSYAKKMVLCMSELQKNRKTTSKNVFTLRDLFRWGNRYTFADKKLLEDNKYDWNQHLIEEGYLVLSSKVRTDIEIEIIQETLYKNFRKKVDLSKLFDLQKVEESSPVTKNILEAIKAFKSRNDIVWTRNMTRMAVLTAKALQFDEPVLLVGPTGCGKTTICQLLADIQKVHLRILNCHMHTEGADFLGGLRPCRNQDSVDNENESENRKLFEWSDGPLIYSMQEGSYFMADEISLAEDSVLERLNCILEPERTVLLAEKGGIDDSDSSLTDNSIISKDFIIKAKQGFQFLATMNPGGDFGKKELSPALRNRFTEIWCLPSDSKQDLIQIANNCMLELLHIPENRENTLNIASFLVEIVLYIHQTVEKFRFSVRDILAWANYLVKNHHLSFPEKAIFGLETIFLDALDMLPHESETKLEETKGKIIEFAIQKAKTILKETFSLESLAEKRGQEVILETNRFGIHPFFIPINSDSTVKPNKNFLFEAPTTKNNLFRLLSSLTLNKAILLEGAPGVGKTSIVESLAKAIGYDIVRINLCEHTDLADLFGTDLPAEDEAFNQKDDFDENPEKSRVNKMGSFVWRDGPLLAALKANNTWILLDELNLAPQSVLEGLNAILDHRGEVYIPELNKTFSLSQQTRIFACQNPLRQGGGRKGLPQSFLNRFTKVYLKKLTNNDLLFVINSKYSLHFQRLHQNFEEMLQGVAIGNENDSQNLFDLCKKQIPCSNSLERRNLSSSFDLSERLVKFSELLDNGIAAMEFGYKGGPFEINLRDILRWCDLLIHPETGFITKPALPLSTENSPDRFLYFKKNFQHFLLLLYERMKLVYYQRMRSDQDKLFIRNAFAQIFNCNADCLNSISEQVSLYWTDDTIYLNDIVLKRESNDHQQQTLKPLRSLDLSPLLLSSQREILKNLIECVHMEKPVLLCGHTDTGKTKLIDTLCTLSNQICNMDTIDDSVTGSFQQIDLNRHLEEIAQKIEAILMSYLQKIILDKGSPQIVADVFEKWTKYLSLNKVKIEFNSSAIMSEELKTFRQRLQNLESTIEKLLTIQPLINPEAKKLLLKQQNLLRTLQKHVEAAESLNTGGSFEWVDSQIVEALKDGEYILLEHVNLCSSAVLDRLNPVFEPNGNLLISEKGVTANETSELVEKAPNFRAFLTIDPKNGELSRAMRNRCIELALNKDLVYTIDDMKAIVHSQGVTHIEAIKCIIRIHQSIAHLTEINNYTISNLTQFSFLTASYTRIGYPLERAIYVAGMEVYVYSTSIDLMGFGLSYYQNKLRDIVVEESKQLNQKARQSQEDHLSNTILNSSDLNILSLIKLQMEPLKILLKENEDLIPVTALQDLFNDFQKINFEMMNAQQLKRYFIYMLFEASSMNDAHLRHLSLEKLLPFDSDLSNLSKDLFDCLEKYKDQFDKALCNLPWNAKLFPRIRDYATQFDSTTHHQKAFSLSCSLLARLIVTSLPVSTETNYKAMDAFTYSDAVIHKRFPNKLNNDFLTHLSTFLKQLHQILHSVLDSSTIDLNLYIEMITSYLWFNRLVKVSEGLLSENPLEKLILHFKWLEKTLLKRLKQVLPNYLEMNVVFEKPLQKLNNYVTSVKHPLNLLRKLYSKQITHFQPFYQEDQCHLYGLLEDYDQNLSIVPCFGDFSQALVQRKLYAQQTEAAKRLRKAFHKEEVFDLSVFNYKFKEIKTNNPNSKDEIPASLKLSFQKFFNEMEEKNLTTPGNESNELNSLLEAMKELQQLIKSQEEELDESQKPHETDVNLLPLKEFYLIKVLAFKVYGEENNLDSLVNEIYCEEMFSLGSKHWLLLSLLKTRKFKNYQNFWKELCSYAKTLQNPKDFEGLLTKLNGSYRYLGTFRRLMNQIFFHLQLNSLSVRLDCLQALNSGASDALVKSNASYQGPSLVSSVLNVLFNEDGNFKPIPLQDLDKWKKNLQNLRQLIWLNSFTMTKSFSEELNNYQLAKENSRHLLQEIDYIEDLCLKMENENRNDYNEGFQSLVEFLRKTFIQLKENEITTPSTNHSSLTFQYNLYYSSLAFALCGALELSLLTFTPLIDPVEKNRLKKLYNLEDINCLSTLINVYDFMKIIMHYKSFGHEIYMTLQNHLQAFKVKEEKLSQKMALRPEKCLYNQLNQEINHFLTTNCEPQALNQLFLQIEKQWLSLQDLSRWDKIQMESLNQTLKRLDLWLSNSQRFLNHTLKKFNEYYQDFIQPLQCSIGQLRFGFENLKIVLSQKRDALLVGKFVKSINAKGKTHSIIANIIDFPSAEQLEIFDITSSKDLSQNRSSIFSLLDKVPGSQYNYFRLLKAKLIELENRIKICNTLKLNEFQELDFAFSICNQIWQQEEDLRRKQKAENDSLYVTKTKCEDENEEVLELEEIAENFPTHLEEDFGDFIQEDSLEKVIKLNKKANGNLKPKLNQIILDEDYSFIAKHFINLIGNFSKVYYHHPLDKKKEDYLELLEPFKEKLKVFNKLYSFYKSSLTNTLNEEAYNSLAFAVGLQQHSLNEISLSDERQSLTKTYNFYKDSNISEILDCMDVLNDIERKVNYQLEMYPEHASLTDILIVIKRIKHLQSTAPIVRFSTGFQILRQKVAQWNEVAHKDNHLRDEELVIADYVQKWTKLELQYWRNCLNDTAEKVEANAYRYWFFIYNLIQEFLQDHEVDNTLTDIKYTEKRFANGEILDSTELEKKSKVSCQEIIEIFLQFMESSSYGDFSIRMHLLQAFELYLHQTKELGELHINEEQLESLICGLRNLQIYFSQFSSEIDEIKRNFKAPIEKKLKEFVKIESYNKDLSYFSMRNNVVRVHRNLNKFLKEYSLQLKQKITAVFQPKDCTTKDYNLENDKGKDLRTESSIKYSLIEEKFFLANPKLPEKYGLVSIKSSLPDLPSSSNHLSSLLDKVNKYFVTSRNVVKDTINNCHFPYLIVALDEVFVTQMDHCEHLRSLTVDRSKEKPQQVIQAKQILQQKRKGLSDLFKCLTQLGLNYKTGLMEASLRSDFENYQLKPFCMKTMFGKLKDKRGLANLLHLNENLDKYYAKSVFKLKLLQNIMLKPLSELGPPNIDRIKGFAVDLFLLIQSQRELLATTSKSIYDMSSLLHQLKLLAESHHNEENQGLAESAFNYHLLKTIHQSLQETTSRIRFVFEQFNVTLLCIPSKQNEDTLVLKNNSESLLKNTLHFQVLEKTCQAILQQSKHLLNDLNKISDHDFLNYSHLKALEEQHSDLVKSIYQVKDYFKGSKLGEYLPLAKPLTHLLAFIEEKAISSTKTSSTSSSEAMDFGNFDNELENIVHLALLALQKLYKKYHQPAVSSTENDSSNNSNSPSNKKRSSKSINEDLENSLQPHHLKKQIHQQLKEDWSLLNSSQILFKLSNILLQIKLSPTSSEKLSSIRKLISLIPILEQYHLMSDYYLFQQLGAHKITAKMSSVMLTVFIEISTKGFCVPPDLLQDEDEGQGKQESQKDGESFGLEDGSGEKDASDKIESEDQLDDAKRPEDRKDEPDPENQDDCKEEKGIDMSEDFDGKMQDIEKPENEEDDSGESEDEEDLNKEMGETEEGADKLDDQIWGDDEEEQPEEDDQDMKEEDSGKGTKDEKDSHNDLDSKNEAANENDKNDHEDDGLDAATDPTEDKRKKEEKDIDEMKDEQNIDEDQENPYHNDLEEPPEAEEMDLGDLNNENDDNETQDDDPSKDDNPFDIDAMKENMQNPNENDDDEPNVNEDNENKDDANDSADSDNDENEDKNVSEDLKVDNSEQPDDKDEEKKDEETEEETPTEAQTRGDKEEEKEDKEDEQTKDEEKPEDYSQSKDKSSKEENVQSIPETEQQGSADQVQSKEDESKDIKQEHKMDEQETGEEKDGVGQAEDENDDGGHQGIADTKETVSQEERKQERNTQEKRKQGRTNEERTLGEAEENKLKQLKTIDKLKEQNSKESEEDNEKDQDVEAEEYQHVKDPKSNDKTTLDNATEEQSKKMQHQEDEPEKEDEEMDGDTNENMDLDENEDVADPAAENVEELANEKLDPKSDRPSKAEKSNERLEQPEEMEIEGEVVPTMTVPRSEDTTAHCNQEILLDGSVQAEELSAAETLDLRRRYQDQMSSSKTALPQHDDFESWQSISNRMAQNARELCEQLRLILEPTKCTRLKGDYRTGRRINMKKIIPYIASQFRKDKIWLRRTKPAQRDYKITIAIDDSKSMHHNNSKTLTLEAISLVSQALTLLESGRLSVVSFGESPKIILNHTEQFDGPRLVNSLNFEQNKTKIAELLHFIRAVNSEEGSSGSDNGIFENLVLVLSDGRNIFAEGKAKVRSAIKLARLERMFLVYIIIDNPENKDSILDIQSVEMLPDKRIDIKSYLDEFPFPYYVIVRDLNQLPLVLSEAMRQWFELVNSEQ